jgi:serine/threonine protein phosphatase PrpC
LATDGVTDAISDEELATIVKKNGRVETIVEEVLLKVDRKPKLYKMTRA